MIDSDESPDENLKRMKRKKRGDGTEASRVRKRLQSFNSETCKEFVALKSMFGKSLTHNELKSIALVACANTESKLKLDRDASRDNRVLIKWFAENWDELRPHLQNMTLRDSSEKILCGSKEDED